MNVVGIGTDIIEIERIQQLLAKHGKRFYERLFLPSEIEYCLGHRFPERHFAGRFAAKESIAKALGTGFGKQLSWHDIEIVRSDQGQPQVILHNAWSDYQVHLSISHCKTLATATALITRS